MEIWKKVQGFSLYEISNLGRIRSTNYKRTGRIKILKPALDPCGYYRTMLKRDSGGYLTQKIHRLVALAFLKEPIKETVNHKNGIKTDNRVLNLEWMTRSENSKHSFLNGLQSPKYGELNGCAKVTKKQVFEIRKIANERGRFYGRKELAQKYGVTEDLIKRIVNRRTWKHI